MAVDPQQSSDFAFITALLHTVQQTTVDYYLGGTINVPPNANDPNDRHNRAIEIVESLMAISGPITPHAPGLTDPYGCKPPTECVDGVCIITGGGLPAARPRPTV